ncbi:hypothetical protein Enr13x_53800 [Stieleria neptunia]|uniref:Uncharacterized protein n=1 Tax=Stieleria neptunia TaxID=2527979 RepID=A0A518HXD2_9BACT|nr:hypothetical protein [Stieleria neptunia]QDV45501.1 hypothetical protein Enr13x_53800 [Stieleria neptunia]
MSHPLEKLIVEIQALERSVADKIHGSSGEPTDERQHQNVVFDADLRRRHRVFAKSLWRYMLDSTVMTVLTAPVIYALLIPVSMLDLFVTVYQWVCFPVYRIPAVCRHEYVVIDRHQLAYLNAIEKLNCVYCGYANGVLAYAREIASRTEQYWCPIKHARRVKGCHTRQCLFCRFGDAEGYRHELDRIRKRFTDLQ